VTSVCRVPHFGAGPQAGQSKAKLFLEPNHESECHSERLDPLLRGQTERFSGGPMGGGGVGLLMKTTPKPAIQYKTMNSTQRSCKVELIFSF
jgi:hypothetical protein